MTSFWLRYHLFSFNIDKFFFTTNLGLLNWRFSVCFSQEPKKREEKNYFRLLSQPWSLLFVKTGQNNGHLCSVMRKTFRNPISFWPSFHHLHMNNKALETFKPIWQSKFYLDFAPIMISVVSTSIATLFIVVFFKRLIELTPFSAASRSAGTLIELD